MEEDGTMTSLLSSTKLLNASKRPARLEATRKVQGSVAGTSLTERLCQQLSVVIQSCMARAALRRSVGALDAFQ